MKLEAAENVHVIPVAFSSDERMDYAQFRHWFSNVIFNVFEQEGLPLQHPVRKIPLLVLLVCCMDRQDSFF